MINDTAKSDLAKIPAPEAAASIMPQSLAPQADCAAAPKKIPLLADFDLRQMNDEWIGQLGLEQTREVAIRLLHTAKHAKTSSIKPPITVLGHHRPCRHGQAPELRRRNPQRLRRQ